MDSRAEFKGTDDTFARGVPPDCNRPNESEVGEICSEASGTELIATKGQVLDIESERASLFKHVNIENI